MLFLTKNNEAANNIPYWIIIAALYPIDVQTKILATEVKSPRIKKTILDFKLIWNNFAIEIKSSDNEIYVIQILTP